MANLIAVRIHESEFPERFAAGWQACLRERRIRPKFHYLSHKQVQRWLRLFGQYSPHQRDAEAAAIYGQAFAQAGHALAGQAATLVGLGCGGGQKEAQLLDALHAAGKSAAGVALDVSPGLAITAARRWAGHPGCAAVHPVVLDLETATDLPEVLDEVAGGTRPRIVTFFGMIPNFEPNAAMAKLAAVMRPQDWLLFSANLAPGDDYEAGVRRVLPQYDNPPTREWLLTFLHDAGFEREDGELRFGIERPPTAPELRRIVADYHIVRPRTLALEGESFAFAEGEVIRAFFSYRYTPALVRTLLARHGLAITADWISASGEEGVFACRRG